jgi:hypothetical protein
MPSAQRCAGPAAGSSTEQQRSHRLHIGAGHARRMKIDQRSPFDVRPAAPPAANTAHNSAACRRVRQRCRKIMKMCNEAPCVPPQCWRCLRRYRHCCQSATRRRQVERRLLPTKGHRLRPVARLKWCPVHVDGRRAPGPKYEAAPSTKRRPTCRQKALDAKVTRGGRRGGPSASRRQAETRTQATTDAHSQDNRA